MRQKYKIFIKDTAVIVAESGDMTPTKPDVVSSTIESLKGLAVPEVHQLLVPDPNVVLDRLKRELKHVVAGGGFVLAPNGDVLMIFRRGKWDLPKGKTETGESIEETAIREVEEECGISGLNIESDAYSTFHLYREHDAVILKESVWFKMTTKQRQELIPQEEEDITRAEWVRRPISSDKHRGAFPSIREVLDHFSQSL